VNEIVLMMSVKLSPWLSEKRGAILNRPSRGRGARRSSLGWPIDEVDFLRHFGGVGVVVTDEGRGKGGEKRAYLTSFNRYQGSIIDVKAWTRKFLTAFISVSHSPPVDMN